jgi:hypothetical protein
MYTESVPLVTCTGAQEIVLGIVVNNPMHRQPAVEKSTVAGTVML